MAGYVDVAGLDDVPAGASLHVCVDGFDVALFNVDHCIHAIADACLIDGAPLTRGEVRGRVVACARHNGQYDIATGELVGVAGLRVERFPLRVIEGRILVDLER